MKLPEYSIGQLGALPCFLGVKCAVDEEEMSGSPIQQMSGCMLLRTA